MKHFEFYDGQFYYKRISKRVAERAYKNGLRVILCPWKLRPGYPYYPETSISGKADCDFQTAVNAFIYYNCRPDTGKYPAYYIPVRTVDRFTGDAPTLDSMCNGNTVEEYDYRYTGV